MPQRGAAGFGRSGRDGTALPPLVIPFDPDGEIVATDSRAATRAALADAFAERFGIDDSGPSAAALADRFGFRYEDADAEPGLPAGRRTVTITGRGALRAVPPSERSPGREAFRGARRSTGRAGAAPVLRADRVALLAVGLGLLLAFLAATSAHAAALAALAPPH
jgi:hypothetical protein